MTRWDRPRGINPIVARAPPPSTVSFRSTGSTIARYHQMADPSSRRKGTAGEIEMLQSRSTGMAPRYRRLALGIALCALAASCDDDYGRGGCYGCGNVTPVETSAGVVSADFN